MTVQRADAALLPTHLSPLELFAEAFREELFDIDGEHAIHPAGAVIAREYLVELRDAAYCGDAAEAKRLMDLIRRRIAQERAWELENRATFKSLRNRV